MDKKESGIKDQMNGWKFTEEQRPAVCCGEICPKCLGTRVELVGATPDGLHLNQEFDCLDCGEQWEGY